MRTWITGDDREGGIVEDPLDSFIRWLLFELNGGVSRTLKTYALAHYSGRYDMHLLAGGIYRLGGISPKIIRSGNKIYELEIAGKRKICPHVSFRDTFNWMSLSLAELPKTLDLDEQEKGFFPHGYNRNENLDIVRAQLPPIEDYFPKGMRKEKRKKFEEWYAQNLNTPFCLREQLKIYCDNDVMVLAHAVARFHALFRSLAPTPEKEDDIISNTLTIASACIRHLCINYLVPGQIAIMPDMGYHKRDIQSFKGLKFMQWYAHHHGLPVQHRDSSAAGEYRLRIPATGEEFRLDGWVQREPQERNLCLEFNGCAWHGHDCVYEPDEICLNGKTSLANMDEVRRRKHLIESMGIETQFFWECEVDRMLEEDEEMRDFFDGIRDTSLLIPRDALFGGRTGPLSLKCDLSDLGDLEGEFDILYYDIVSLYPAMNYLTEYPVGHPEVVVLNKRVDWTRPEDNREGYRGLFKVFIVPPTDLYLPVVPHRIRGKLTFTLCYTCALNGSFEAGGGNKRKAKHNLEFFTKEGVLREPYTPELGRRLCPHLGDDDARGWVAILTDIEMNLALEKGYRVTHIYNLYHWKEWTNELFRPYVRQFMRMKIHASGWPPETLCPDDPVLEERLKSQFIDRNRRDYGIEIQPGEMRKNVGLRYVSKICNNSMWGRWSLRNNLAKDLITDSNKELHGILNDPKLELGAVELLTGKIVAVPYRRKRDFVKTGKRNNVMLAIQTTAAARATLYGYMERIQQSPHSKLLYTDTDSTVFMHRRGEPLPFKAGSMLGQMDNEFPGYRITSFYCGGNKQHAEEMVDEKTGEVKEVLKCRGCTLDSTNEDVFNMRRFKEMVNNFGRCEPLVLTRQRFQPSFTKGCVTTQTVHTTYRPIFDKAHIDAHLDIYPYGYTGPPVRFITNKRHN